MTPDARAQTVDGDVVNVPRPSRSRRPPTIVVALVVPLVALIAILVTRAVEGPSSASAAAGANTVVIRNFSFQPARLTVAPGTHITITNRDGTAHTMSARNGAFDTGPLDGGKSATITVNKAGTYAYRCRIHSNMHGTLVVK